MPFMCALLRWNLVALAAFAVVIGVAFSSAAGQLVIDIGAPRTVESATLLARPDAATITVPMDLSYGRDVFVRQKRSSGGRPLKPRLEATTVMTHDTPVFRRGGRPRKSNHEKRGVLISARVRPDELSAIEERAAASNRMLSDFIREQALTGKVLVKAFNALSAIDRHDLARIGSNLNQIARLQYDWRYSPRPSHRVRAG